MGWVREDKWLYPQHGHPTNDSRSRKRKSVRKKNKEERFSLHLYTCAHYPKIFEIEEGVGEDNIVYPQHGHERSKHDKIGKKVQNGSLRSSRLRRCERGALRFLLGHGYVIILP